MGLGIHNPLPSSLSSECKKCGNILSSFIDPRQSFGPDKVIPPSILASAKGLAILTVIKAGFLGSARFGSGLVVARLPDGSWSAPSAIATGGAGFGGQIGFELTDFVFILNDASAVKTFAQAGSLTLGGNVSIAAGPVGRNAEAAGAASLKSVSGIFSYSKTKGLFAGVSLEGSVIIERKDANTRLYGRPISAGELIAGSVRPPPSTAPLLNILNSRSFSGLNNGSVSDSNMYNDIPVYDDNHDEVVWGQNRTGSAYGEGLSRSNTVNSRSNVDNNNDNNNNNNNNNGSSGGGGGWDAGSGTYNQVGRTKRANTWQDPVYDSPLGGSTSSQGPPSRPAAPKPNFQSKQALLRRNEAVALFNFDAAEPGDLGFKKGDVITVLKKTDSDNDWWTGMIGTSHGIFPSNYVKMVEG